MTMQGPDYAVFTKLTPDRPTMTPGFNTPCVYRRQLATRQQYYRFNFKTGAITLAPGSYSRSEVVSMSTYNSGGEPPEITHRAITRRSRLLPVASSRPEGDRGRIQYAVDCQ